MTADNPRFTWGLIIDVFDVLERHGFRRGDDQHTGRAVGLVRDLALVYVGEREHPVGATVVELPPPAGAVTLIPAQLGTVLKALTDAVAHRKITGLRMCEDCDTHAAGLCDRHAADLCAVDEYQAVERQLIDQAGGT